MIITPEQAALKAQHQFDALRDYVGRAARDGQRIDTVERELFRQLLGLGHSLLSAFVAQQGDGDLGPEAEIADGHVARRLPECHDRRYVSIFGEPSNQGRWGWRVEGHHLSLNFTIRDGAIDSATPAFFGANPAEVRQGPREGLRTLADFEDRALRLLQALDEGQKTRAVVAAEAPRDIESNTETGQQSPYGGLAIRPPSDAREGIPAAELNPDQRRMLMDLIRAYAADMPDEVADAWLGEVEQAGDDLAFAWYGAAERSQPHGYQIQGPTFQIEFNNTQNNANHIHSAWRNTLDDFGLETE